MPQNNLKLLLAHLLLIAMADCNQSRTIGNAAYNPADAHQVYGGNAFHALWSCHQVLRGESGEFFAPDYLCSNPPLWCNWTIQVDPGKRIHLHLEDFTPSDACSGNPDQIYLDESMGVEGGHSILEKCWVKAKYTSLSNTLNVVLLIGGSPSLPHRGFYGRYEAFRLPVTYNVNRDTTKHTKMITKPKVIKHKPSPAPKDFTKFSVMNGGDPLEAILLEMRTPSAQGDPDVNQVSSSTLSEKLSLEGPTFREGTLKYSPVQGEETYWNRRTSEQTEATEPEADAHSAEEHREVVNLSGDLVTLTPPVLVTHQGIFQSGRGTTQSHTAHTGSEPSTQQPRGLHPKPSLQNQSAMRRDVDAQSQETTNASKLPVFSTVSDVISHKDRDEAVYNEESLNMITNESTVTSYTQSTIETQDPFDHLSNMVDPLSKRRHYEKVKNHTEIPHFPGDTLFEVAVEVSISEVPEKSWNHVARTLLKSVKSLMNQQLKMVQRDILSCKRIKRLNAGVLYIFWLQNRDGMNVNPHRLLQDMLLKEVGLSRGSAQSLIISVSTVDVNECLTQLVLCDINAECVNRFGSYECHCRSGFKDVSRLGSGGTLCLDTAGTEHYTCTPQTMIEGVYAVCVLLILLILLLCAAGVLYYRRHRGAIMIRCWSSSVPPVPPPDYKNDDSKDNSSINTHSDLPPPPPPIHPPPPPIRRPKEGWVHPKDCCPSVDLPLLRFSPLKPLDGYTTPGES
ncbi:hypothetical protein UPYG_G00068030 [Umbra pygmaea]|uniref:CUB domain-containing protein n=1 Tax=Umbra pygmaea TaxID=75934 RepID=A0ABD0XB59_UMBPY